MAAKAPIARTPLLAAMRGHARGDALDFSAPRREWPAGQAISFSFQDDALISRRDRLYR